MSLIGISILIGIICFMVGGSLGGEFYAYVAGIVGFFSPGMYVLEQLYHEVKKSK
jgi:hypothetical protein